MFLYLVHHGEAVDAALDPQRPLSEAGAAAVRRVAAAAAARSVKPETIWHSGKLRARQTADTFWRECNPLADDLAVHGLQPNDPPAWVAGRLPSSTGDIMLVGHMPHLGSLLGLLVGDEGVTFPAHGLVALQLGEDGWRERWRLAGA